MSDPATPPRSSSVVTVIIVVIMVIAIIVAIIYVGGYVYKKNRTPRQFTPFEIQLNNQSLKRGNIDILTKNIEDPGNLPLNVPIANPTFVTPPPLPVTEVARVIV